MVYDEYGNTTKQTTAADTESETVIKTYAGADETDWILGRMTEIKGIEKGHIVEHKKFFYDTDHNLTSVKTLVDAVQGTWSTRTFSEYNDYGMPEKVKDAIGNELTFEYDDFMHTHPVSISSGGNTITKTYDYYTGKVKTETTTGYGTITIKYDEHGRIKGKRYPWEEDDEWSEEYTYYFGDAGSSYIKKTVKDGVKSDSFWSSEGLWTKEFIDLLVEYTEEKPRVIQKTERVLSKLTKKHLISKVVF